MSAGVILRLAVGALCACSAALLLKRDNPLGAFLATLAFCVGAMLALLPAIGSAVEQGRALLEQAGLETELLSPLLRVLGVTVCTRLSSELCKDAGQGAVAAKLELCGAAVSLLCALPLAKRVLELVGALT